MANLESFADWRKMPGLSALHYRHNVLHRELLSLPLKKQDSVSTLPGERIDAVVSEA